MKRKMSNSKRKHAVEATKKNIRVVIRSNTPVNVVRSGSVLPDYMRKENYRGLL